MQLFRSIKLNEAMSYDGSFDHSVAGQELAEGQKCTMLAHFPKTMRPGGLRNPHTFSQFFGIDQGHHNGVGPGGVGKAQSAKGSSKVLRLSPLRQRHAVPLN